MKGKQIEKKRTQKREMQNGKTTLNELYLFHIFLPLQTLLQLPHTNHFLS